MNSHQARLRSKQAPIVAPGAPPSSVTAACAPISISSSKSQLVTSSPTPLQPFACDPPLRAVTTWWRPETHLADSAVPVAGDTQTPQRDDRDGRRVTLGAPDSGVHRDYFLNVHTDTPKHSAAQMASQVRQKILEKRAQLRNIDDHAGTDATAERSSTVADASLTASDVQSETDQSALRNALAQLITTGANPEHIRLEMSTILGLGAAALPLYTCGDTPQRACEPSCADDDDRSAEVARYNLAVATSEAAAADWLRRHPISPRPSVCAVTDSGWTRNVEVANAMMRGQLIRVMAPFPEGVARELTAELAALPEHVWTQHRGSESGFQFCHHNVYLEHSLFATRCPAYVQACRWFETEGLRWFERITGVQGQVVVSASWYREGDYSTPHSDMGRGRRIAFVWHVTPEWDERDGGDLVWCSPYRRFKPSANTMYLFKVSDDSMHFVQTVYARPRSTTARDAIGDGVEPDRKRLAVNGWFVTPPR